MRYLMTEDKIPSAWFNVAPHLPEPLQPLASLVTNLRWSWHPETRDLFEALDPELWRTCGGDPVKVLGEVSAERLGTLAKDRRFLRRLLEPKRRPAG